MQLHNTFKGLQILFIVLVWFSCDPISANYSPTASIRQGPLKGINLESRNGRTYSAFLGIPYGRIEKRFQIAKPDSGWGDIVYDATDFGPICYQNHLLPAMKGRNASENCLSLNVYSPQVRKEKKLAVMVYIHGGGFVWGAARDYRAKYFMDEDIVLVTINYRLGVFGFLSTGDKVIQGNAGLKDQVLALKWIKDNIEAFGGDPNNILIYGESAGGASVIYHMLSPMSAGLFHRAISQSGSALNPWAIQREPLKTAQTIALSVGCPAGSTAELASCLQTKPAEELLIAQAKFTEWFMFPIAPLRPVVEDADGKDPIFLPDSPYNLLASGKASKVPVMIGFVEDEGLFLGVPIIKNETMTAELNTHWMHLAPQALEYKNLVEKEHLDEVSTKIRNFYFENEDVGEDTWDSTTELFSDRYCTHGVYRTVKLLAKKNMVYPYIFSFPGVFSTVNTYFGVKEQYGVTHADELQYLFNGAEGAPEYLNETEILVFSQNLVKLWSSFAQTGKPNATWAPETRWSPYAPHKAQIEWYQIDIKTGIWKDDFESKVKFWESLGLNELQNEKRKDSKDEL